MHDPKVEADEVVALLRQDPPLVAQIIRMANSAAYAPREPIGSLERAVAQVGFAEAHRLVGIVAAAQLAETRLSLYPLDPGKLRINALLVALVMEELAKWTHERPHSCYTVGLLRTIGMMALDRVPPAGAAAGALSGKRRRDGARRLGAEDVGSHQREGRGKNPPALAASGGNRLGDPAPLSSG